MATPDLIIAKNGGFLEYYEQNSDNELEFQQSINSGSNNQITFIPFETNGTSPVEVLTHDSENQTKIYGLKRFHKRISKND